jgi:hypothetical protein
VAEKGARALGSALEGVVEIFDECGFEVGRLRLGLMIPDSILGRADEVIE